VGRLSQILSAPRSRLITLTGSGGAGKTRLALEVAAQIAESKAGGGTRAVFVSLAAVPDPERIYEVILRSLGVSASAGAQSLEQLASVLDARPGTLLVLDNFEQLVPTGAFRIRELLARAASVKVLVTSRQRLLIEGEREYRLSPLPTSADAQTPEELLSVPSIALFVDRAQAVQPDFQLTARNASAVSTLCEVLEGLPLAIELAAARVGTETPSRILEQVRADRLEFLVSRRRDAISRHKTLRTTLDWSYHLLPESAQTLLARLSVFRGGWTVSGAANVCSLSEEEALELLALLLDNSLIRVADREDGLRFMVLETIREYAWERLVGSGEKDLICKRHRDYFAALADQAEPELTGRSQVLWINRLQTEHDNLCAVVEWCQNDDASVQVGLKLAGALCPFWEVRGHLCLGRRYLARALERTDSTIPTLERGKALNRAGMLARSQGDYHAAQALLQEGLKVYEGLNDSFGVATSIDSLGRLAGSQGDNAAALLLHERALDSRRRLGDRAGTATSLFNLGYAKTWWGCLVEAKTLFEESLTIRRELGDIGGVAHSLSSLMYLAFVQGDFVASESLAQDSLLIRRELGDMVGIAQSLDSLGSIANAKHNILEARKLFEESLKIRRDLGDKDGVAHTLYGLGVVALAESDFDSAFRLLQESLNMYRETGGYFLIHVLGFLGHVARDAGDFDRAKASYRESLSLRVDRRNISAIAQSLEDFSSLASREGQMERAARLIGAAEAICKSMGRAAPAGPEVDYHRTVEVARESLGEDAYAAAWARGRQLTLEQGVAYALEESAQ
jgi:predicted ATPase